MKSVPHRRPYRRRSNYQFRTELSGLEQPHQWLRLLGSVIGAIGVALVIAFVAFG